MTFEGLKQFLKLLPVYTNIFINHDVKYLTFPKIILIKPQASAYESSLINLGLKVTVKVTHSYTFDLLKQIYIF